MAEVAVTVAFLFVERCISLLCKEGSSKNSVSTEFESIKNVLSRLTAYLNVHSGRGSQNEIQANKAAQIRRIVHQIEDALDEFMYQTPCKFHRHRISTFGQRHLVQPMRVIRPLHELSATIKDIKGKCSELKGWDESANYPGSTSTVEEASSSRTNSNWRGDSFLHSLDEYEIVGFENQSAALLDQLVREEQNCRMKISVVGPGGFGKSTLVKIAYLDKQVKMHFDCCAWVTVSESFDETALVDGMILQFEDKVKGGCVSLERAGNKESGNKLQMIKSFLQHRRYLVVLDDVCNKKDLQFIESFLPENSGSRIIVTCHKHDLVVCLDESPHRVHDLNGLSDEAAWNLFSRKAFFYASGKSCPVELEGIARRILRMCGGSPYAILSISSMLAMKAQLPAEWQDFYDSLGHEIGTDPDFIVSKTMLRSYNDLSSNIKSCFLYLSAFPGNYHIERGRLIRLWLAEGFVKKPAIKGKNWERVADDYLDELIARNLMDVVERDFSGRATICVVKNLVHKFLVNKSNEENFVSILSDEDPAETRNNHQLRRVSIRSDAYDLSKSKLTSEELSSVRSSFMFSKNETHQPKIGKFLSLFKLLKVLDLQGSSLEIFPEEICRLNLLRYLSLRGTRIKTIPASIDNLVFLETLDLKQTQVRTLPNGIIRLPNLTYLLVHLHDVENYVTFDSVKGVELCPEVRFLSKLLKLTLIKAKDPKLFLELGYLKELRKLGLIDLKTEDGGKLCSAIQKMAHLSTLDVSAVSESHFLDLHKMENPPRYLQRIYLKGRLTAVPNWIPSLPSLVRIGLLWSKLPESPVPALQALPNLIELKLVDAYIGNELVFGAGNFSKLRILHIEECMNLTKINIQDNAIPKLGSLTLCKCKSLMLPPLGIGNLAQIQELHALDMNDEFNAALRPSSSNYWMVAHIPVIRSFHAGRSGKWISNETSRPNEP